jgi:ABC-2 type transport system permease protein
MNPPRVTLKTREIGDPAAHRSTVTEMLFPGIVLLVVLMMSAGMSLEVWKEAGAGAVRRVAASPCSLNGLLGGKLAATSVVLLAAILLTFASARVVFEIPMRACVTALAWSACCAMTVYCGLLLVQLLFAGERTATTVAGMTMVPLAMLGGCFFPLESMREHFAKFARVTPNGWMLVRLKSILAGPVPAAELARDFGWLLAAGAVLFALARWRMERRFAA